MLSDQTFLNSNPIKLYAFLARHNENSGPTDHMPVVFQFEFSTYKIVADI